MQSRSSGNLKGIDVSHYQGVINFTKVRAAGIEIVYIKATEGANFIDSKLQQNYKGAKAAGLRVGFYHFFRPKNEANAKQQAQFYVNNIKALKNDCRHAIDLEVTQGLGKNTVSNLATIFLEEIKRLTGEDVVIYTYTNFAKNYVSEVLKDYPLWIANYGVDIPRSNPVWDSWIGFQYSSTGAVSGITGKVDLDVFTHDILLQNGDSSIPVIAPAPKPEKTVDSKVLELQKKLNKLKIGDAKGNKLAQDGINSPGTIEAVKKLQSICGLVVNGIVDNPFMKALNQILSKPVTKLGSDGMAVRYIQYRTGANIDGLFGTETENKVKQFQKNSNLAVDGIVGPSTWAKLIG